MAYLRECFGSRLRVLRRAAGLTQEEVAARTDLSVDFISLVERGKSAPSFDSLAKLADALGVEVREFFDFEWGRARKTDETG